MTIIWAKEEDLSAYQKSSEGKVYSALVNITDISGIASNMLENVKDTSWIDQMDTVAQITFKATAERTIEKLVKCIISQSDDNLSEDFGEYMISDTAQEILSSEFYHQKLPIAELIKEKVSGNPGFDFHTEGPEKIISYGEAKYSGVTTRYSDALTQIADFISNKKDDAELNTLQKLVTQQAIENYTSGQKAYTAAFSVNANDPEKIMVNTLLSTHIDPLLEHKEIYIIGIYVNAK